MILGKVTNVENEGLRVQIDGDPDGTVKKYRHLASYIPAVGDRVLIEKIGGSYVILGKLIK